ncbi:MAG: enoyl-CoA hydratase/isomerase family protein [Candidatus Binataceae bacterium]
MADYAKLLFEIRDHVAHVTFNRPEAANAMDAEMAREFEDCIAACDDEKKVRAILLTGAGKMFCAGGDLKAFAAESREALPAFVERMASCLHRGIARMARMAAPVVAAVNGAAGGAGMSIACAADFVFAADSAKFTMAYTRAGLTPDGSSSYFLPRIVGFRRAAELMIANPVLDAARALELGIATRVVPANELIPQAEKFAVDLAAGATLAYGTVKRLLLSSANNTLESQMELEGASIARMMTTADAREGIAAFVAKRPPKFTAE